MVNILQVKAELEHLFKVELKTDRQDNTMFSYEKETDKASYTIILHKFAGNITTTYEIQSYRTHAYFSCSERIDYIGKLETFYEQVKALKEMAKQYL